MSPPETAKPPRRRTPRRDPAGPRPHSRGAGRTRVSSARSRRIERDRRVLPIALGVSVALHVLLLFAWRTSIDPVSPPPPPTTVAVQSPPAGLQVVALREVADEVASPVPPRAQADESPAVPPRVPSPVEPGEAAADAPGREPPADGSAGAEPSALDALRPRLADPRLWIQDERVSGDASSRMRAYAELRAWNDSITLAQERERRATDWTFTDDKGRRWGVSPGMLHLGDIKIPLPAGFTATPGHRDELNERIRMWEQIQSQAERQAIQEEIDDRIRAIRERRDAERSGEGSASD